MHSLHWHCFCSCNQKICETKRVFVHRSLHARMLNPNVLEVMKEPGHSIWNNQSLFFSAALSFVVSSFRRKPASAFSVVSVLECSESLCELCCWGFWSNCQLKYCEELGTICFTTLLLSVSIVKIQCGMLGTSKIQLLYRQEKCISYSAELRS